MDDLGSAFDDPSLQNLEESAFDDSETTASGLNQQATNVWEPPAVGSEDGVFPGASEETSSQGTLKDEPLDTVVATAPSSTTLSPEVDIEADGPRPPPGSPPDRRVYSVKHAWLVGTLAGVPVHLHYIFFIVFILDAARALMIQDDSVFLWVIFFWIGDIFLFASVLAHEFSHVFATRAVGGHATHVLLWPLGGLAYCGHTGGWKKDLLIAFAGPLAHVPIFIAFLFLTLAVSDVHLFLYYTPIKNYFAENLLNMILDQQVSLFIFNLFIPAFPLDGGRIYATLLLRYFPKVKAAKIIIGTSIPIALGMIIWSLVSFGGSLSTLVGLWLLYQSYIIWKAIQHDTIEQLPIFTLDRHSGSHSEKGGSYRPPEQHQASELDETDLSALTN